MYCQFAFSQAHELDSTFGIDGVVNLPFFQSSSTKIGNFSIASDKKLTVTGFIDYHNDIMKIFGQRFLEDGSIDKSFNEKGFTIKKVADYVEVYNTIQPDGKTLVLIPQFWFFYSDSSFVLTRLNVDGTLDKSFGTDGKIEGFAFLTRVKLALQKDGKILVLKQRYPQGYTILRYTSAGKLDTTFGNQGYISEDRYISQIATDSKGRIIYSGYPYENIKSTFVKCLLPDGSIDTTFGNSGTLEIYFPFLVYNAYSTKGFMSILLNGDIIISWTGYQDIGMSKCNSNGIVDDSFGKSGKVIYSYAEFSVIYGMDVNSSGKIMFATPHSLIRFKQNGSVDTGYGKFGQFEISGEQIQQISYQADDRLIVARKGVFTPPTLIRFKSDTVNNIKPLINNPQFQESKIFFKIFPNPVTSVVYISDLDATSPAEITISDNTGRIVHSSFTQGVKKKAIQVSELKSGIYYIQIKQNNQLQTLKMIKQ